MMVLRVAWQEAGAGGGRGDAGAGRDVGETVWDRRGVDEGEDEGAVGSLVSEGGGVDGSGREGRPGELLAGILMLAGMLLMVFVVMNWARRKTRARRSRPDLAPDERLAELRARAARVDPIAAAAVESEQVARRFASMLDNKSRRLELLLDDTDARIARLEQLLDLASSRGVPEGEVLRRVDAGGVVGGSGSGGGDGVGFGERVGLGGGVGGGGADLGDDGDDAAVDPLTREVYALADAGLAAAEIARRLEQHTGKVELILALRSA